MKKMNSQPRILLADDHPGVLENVSKLLGPQYKVVGAVENGKKLLEAANKLAPDLIILDIAMPELDGIKAAKKLLQNGNSTKVIFLTIQKDQDYIEAALATGAHGYVLKHRMQSDLLKAIQQVLKGDSFISPIR
jgi:DNA-binding NarL/FixJ family response regulator